MTSEDLLQTTSSYYVLLHDFLPDNLDVGKGEVLVILHHLCCVDAHIVVWGPETFCWVGKREGS